MPDYILRRPYFDGKRRWNRGDVVHFPKKGPKPPGTAKIASGEEIQESLAAAALSKAEQDAAYRDEMRKEMAEETAAQIAIAVENALAAQAAQIKPVDTTPATDDGKTPPPAPAVPVVSAGKAAK